MKQFGAAKLERRLYGRRMHRRVPECEVPEAVSTIGSFGGVTLAPAQGVRAHPSGRVPLPAVLRSPRAAGEQAAFSERQPHRAGEKLFVDYSASATSA